MSKSQALALVVGLMFCLQASLFSATPILPGSLTTQLLFERGTDLIYTPPPSTFSQDLASMELTRDTLLALPSSLQQVWVQARTYEYKGFEDEITVHYTRNLPTYGVLMLLVIYQVYFER